MNIALDKKQKIGTGILIGLLAVGFIVFSPFSFTTVSEDSCLHENSRLGADSCFVGELAELETETTTTVSEEKDYTIHVETPENFETYEESRQGEIVYEEPGLVFEEPSLEGYVNYQLDFEEAEVGGFDTEKYLDHTVMIEVESMGDNVEVMETGITGDHAREYVNVKEGINKYEYSELVSGVDEDSTSVALNLEIEPMDSEDPVNTTVTEISIYEEDYQKVHGFHYIERDEETIENSTFASLQPDNQGEVKYSNTFSNSYHETGNYVYGIKITEEENEENILETFEHEFSVAEAEAPESPLGELSEFIGGVVQDIVEMLQESTPETPSL